jgi:hypothetical protein
MKIIAVLVCSATISWADAELVLVANGRAMQLTCADSIGSQTTAGPPAVVGISGMPPSGDADQLARLLRQRDEMVAAIDAGIAEMKRMMADGKKKNEITAELRKILDGKLKEAAGADQRSCLESIYGPTIRGVSQSLRDGPMPTLPYEALTSQIAALERRRDLLKRFQPPK